MLNFGEDGFAVLVEGAVREENQVSVSTTEEGKTTYTFTPSCGTLEAGDVVVFTATQDYATPVKVESVTTLEDGSLVVTAEDEVYLCDLYEVLKVDVTTDVGAVAQEQTAQATPAVALCSLEEDYGVALASDDIHESTADLVKISTKNTFGPVTVAGEFSLSLTVSVVYDSQIFGEGYFEQKVVFGTDGELGVTVADGGGTSTANGQLSIVTGGWITGTVTNSDDAAVSGATVAVYLGDTLVGSYTTGEDGVYTTEELDAGTYSLKASHDDYGVAGLEEVTVVLKETATADLRLLKGEGVVSGTVTAYVNDGTPFMVKGGKAFLCDESGYTEIATANISETGEYVFEAVEYGNYKLRFFSTANRIYEADCEVTFVLDELAEVQNASLNITGKKLYDVSVWWTMDEEGALILSGWHGMPNYEAGEAPWYVLRDGIRSVVVKEGVKGIGSYVFYDCYNLTSVTFPETSLTSISDYAFASCTKLESITFPGTINSEYVGYYNFGDRVLSGCTALKTVVFEEGIQGLGDFFFIGCTSLKCLVYPSTLETTGVNPFYKCGELTCDVYYNGSKEDLLATGKTISTPSGSITIHYNSTGPEEETE